VAAVAPSGLFGGAGGGKPPHRGLSRLRRRSIARSSAPRRCFPSRRHCPAGALPARRTPEAHHPGPELGMDQLDCNCMGLRRRWDFLEWLATRTLDRSWKRVVDRILTPLLQNIADQWRRSAAACCAYVGRPLRPVLFCDNASPCAISRGGRLPDPLSQRRRSTWACCWPWCFDMASDRGSPLGAQPLAPCSWGGSGPTCSGWLLQPAGARARPALPQDRFSADKRRADRRAPDEPGAPKAANGLGSVVLTLAVPPTWPFHSDSVAAPWRSPISPLAGWDAGLLDRRDCPAAHR